MSLLVANNGLPGHVAGTSALPPTADLRAPMSAFPPIMSASPPRADIAAVGHKSPVMTQPGHLLAMRFTAFGCPNNQSFPLRPGK